MSKGLILLLDSARGQYIPRDFADFADKWDGIDPDDLEVVKAGPDHEWYWDAWNVIENNATADFDGHTWYLHHDGDLWAVCTDLMTDEEYENFFGEKRGE